MFNLRKILSLMIVICFMASPVRADEIQELKMMMEQLKNDYETRIKALEDKIMEMESNQKVKTAALEEKLEKKIEEKAMNVEYVGRHKASVGDGGLVVDNPFGFGKVTLGGYMDLEYKDLENTDSTFRQHRWIINIGAQLNERLSFNSEYEIEYGGPNTAAGDGEAKVEQAYIDYNINEMIGLRAGALLVPFGRYNLYHDSDLQDLTDRPLVARDIVPTTWTEAGAGIYGEFNPTIGEYEDLIIDYMFYAINGLDDGFSDTGLRGARNSLKTDNNNERSFVGRLGISPDTEHELGISGYWGKYNDEGQAISGIGFDSINTFGPLEIINEYAYFEVDELGTAPTDSSNFFQGAYTQVGYHFWPEFLNDTFLGRTFEDPTFTLVGRYDWALIQDDGDAGTGDNEETRWTFGLNYRPMSSFVVKLEYQINDTENEALENGDNDGFVASVAMGF